MAAKTEVITSGVFLLGMGAGLYTAFCPSLYDVSNPSFNGTETPDLSMKRLRMGQVYASTTILTIGAALSVMHKNMLPFLVSLFMVAAFLGGYEYLLQWEG